MRQIILLAALLILLPVATALDLTLLTTDPAPVVAGGYADLTITVESSAQDVARDQAVLGIQENRLITPITAPKRLGRLQPASTASGTFRVYISEDAPEGELPLVAELATASGTFTETIDLFVEQAAIDADLMVGQLRSTPDLLLPDTKDNRLTVTLQNLGGKKAELIRAELQVPEGQARASSAFSLQDSLSSLEGGAEDDLSFTLDILEGVTRDVPVSLVLRWRERQDEGEAYRVWNDRIDFSLPIDEAPFLRVVNQEALTGMEAGSADNVLRVTIENAGAEEAQDVRVRLFPDTSYPFVFERLSQYIGARIPPGGSASLDVTFEVQRDADPREYAVALELESLVESTRYSQDDTITIPVTAGGGFSGQTWALIIIGAIIVGAAAVALWRRR